MPQLSGHFNFLFVFLTNLRPKRTNDELNQDNKHQEGAVVRFAKEMPCGPASKK